MPQAENVQRGVDVAVVNRAAFAARPFPDPKTLSTFRAAHGIAVRTGHHCTEPVMTRLGIPGTIRASFMFYNTFDEVHQFVAGVAKAISLLRK